MSLTNSLKKIFFLTNSDRNRPIEISEISISFSKNKNKNRRIKYNYKNSNIFSIYDKRHYKLNKDINIFPSPERLKKREYNPVCIKTGQIDQSKNRKNSYNPQFYLPIMKKPELNDPFQSMLLEDISNISHNNKSKADLSLINNKIENLIKKRMNKNKNKDKEDKNEMNMVIKYSFDNYGKPKLKRPCFNLEGYNNNVKQNKIVNIISKINNKRYNHKEQILMRNKHQHTKNYNRKMMPLLNDDIPSEYNKYANFRNEVNANRFNTESQEKKSYISKEIKARDLIKEKMPNYKATGFDQLYINLLSSVRPNKNDSYKDN